MPKDIRVLVVEDDPYARDLMSLLLTRDWRTRVVGEVGSEEDVRRFLSESEQRVDVTIIDTEMPWIPDWHLRVTELIQSIPDPPRMLYTCTHIDTDLLRQLSEDGLGGYILKTESLYALASAVSFVADNHWTITPSILRAAFKEHITLPKKTLVLDGTKRVASFTNRESDVLRLGILFNLAQRDVADELVISPQWVSKIISTVYEKLGLGAILSGEVPLEVIFDNDSVLARCKNILKRVSAKQRDGKTRKAPWMATLAFHLLTIPVVKTPE